MMPLLCRERHHALELIQGRDAVFQLPAPILPIGLWHVLPMALTFKPNGAIFSVWHGTAGNLNPTSGVSNGGRKTKG
jgi:hypothetical protein